MSTIETSAIETSAIESSAIESSTIESDFLGSLLTPAADAGEHHDAWLKARRASALERASALSVPTTRDEDWRFTDLSSLYRLQLKPAQAVGQVDSAVLKTLMFPEATTRLVFVDGHFNTAATSIVNDDKVRVGSLRQALRDDTWRSARSAIESHLATIASVSDDVFTAANTAFLQDAAIVHVAGGAQLVDAPIQVINVATGHEMRSNPRLLIIAGKGSHCTVIEDYVAVGGSAYLTNSVCEIVIAPDAEVRHVKLQREADTAFHIANTTVLMQADSRYRNWSVGVGGRISRHNLNVVQNGTGIDCEMHGLAMISGRQLADTHSSVDHAFAHGGSRQVHKTIAGGSAHAVFNGKILVREGAQQTNSSQQSRNLLLSPRATVDTKPQLEIFADDVKCAHGATVGQMDADEVFYLKSRGLSEAAARNLLTYAFAKEVVEHIPVASVVSVLESHILEQTRNKEA
ncbi:MAG: Fe-S cluster assembly protein SufD [Betaproteobacteria bacterium]|nr:MAG: Fe-S cluster assembly protein SufD [Betaproteobacteria bacterium]